MLGYDVNGARPGAGGLLSDALLKHPGYFHLYNLAAGLWDLVGLLSDEYSRIGLCVVLQEVSSPELCREHIPELNLQVTQFL